MIGPITIREARSTDQPAINDLTRLAFEQHRAIYQPSPAAVSGTSSASLPRIVAELDDILVGTVQYRLAPPRLHLIGLAVHPNRRKLGIARRLVDHLAGLAGVEIVSLYAVKRTGNPSLFERLGFRAIHEQTDGWLLGADGQPVTEVYMERISSDRSTPA